MPLPAQMEIIFSVLCSLLRLSAFKQAQEGTRVLASQDGQAMDGTAQPSTTAYCLPCLDAMKMPHAYTLGLVR